MTLETESPRADPDTIYGQRLEMRAARLRGLQRRDRRFSVVRLIVVLAALGGWAAFGFGVLVAGVAVFFVLVVWHEKTVRARDHAARQVAFYQAGVARLRGEWAGRGQSGAAFLDPGHPYAVDLDIFG